MNGKEFKEGWFHDVEKLILENETLYRDKITPKFGLTPYSQAVEKILQHRRWQPAEGFIKERFEATLRENEIFYVPKVMEPGPSICFVHHDVKGARTRAQLRPLDNQIIFYDRPAKYCKLGENFSFCGPLWLGNSDRVLNLIMNLGYVVLVEGTFDMLACQIIAPGVPVLSTGTKSMNDQHFAYLRIMGCRRIFFMFDKEQSQQGEKAQRALRTVCEGHHLTWRGLNCPDQDPSKCLEDYRQAAALRRALELTM